MAPGSATLSLILWKTFSAIAICVIQSRWNPATKSAAPTLVTIIAKCTPDPKIIDNDPFYTSREAGAHWCSFADKDDLRLQAFEALTLKTLLSISKYPSSGVSQMRSCCLYQRKPGAWQDPWYSDLVPDFRLLGQSELPNGAEFGFQYTTVTINVRKYLLWLLDQFKTQGGKIIVKEVDDIREVFDMTNAKVVVNCTGLGAKYLGGVKDYAVFPTRGQTILIKASHPDSITRLAHYGNDTDAAYIIPRDDGTILLGGTFEVHNANLRPNADVARGIIQRCQSISPILAQMGSNIQVIRHGVGLRPYRKGGFRLDPEWFHTDKKSTLVIHNYGHGGFGYQSSWGSAQAVLEIVDEELVKHKNSPSL